MAKKQETQPAPTTQALAPFEDSVFGGLVQMDSQKFAEYMSQPLSGWSTYEKFTVLKPGSIIKGEFLGQGPDYEGTTKATGQGYTAKTWRVKVSPTVVFRIHGTHQLDQECTPHVRADGTPASDELVEIGHAGYESVPGAKQVAILMIRWRPFGE